MYTIGFTVICAILFIMSGAEELEIILTDNKLNINFNKNIKTI
jgi:hypothetical protein